ncbi:O-antigen ligase family protein [Chryseobacterium daeguense]|uniref:O-antigen ligase family protein n=1 Tax=Chryseobacterium daeguense TaxID=412438 RepID=UPI00138B0BEE|nr:O-antigen ligase family protein [Chryseobacterium daeguense]
MKIKKYYWILGILLGLFPIYVSAARSPVLALLVILFIFLILINKKKYWIFFSIMIIVSLILLFVMYQTGFGNKFIFFERINAAIFERNASGRSFYLNKGIEIFINHPITGGKALFEDGMYPHNIFVEVLMSTGMLGMALFINYYKFVAQSFIKVLKHIDKYKESGVIIFFFLQYFILSQTSGNIYSSFECWYFGAVVIGLGYINFTNEEIKSNDSRGHTAGNH